MSFSLRAYLHQQWRNRQDPVVVFPALPNLETAARERGWQYQEVLPATVQMCPGARALSEDFLLWIERGPRHHCCGSASRSKTRRGLVFGRNMGGVFAQRAPLCDGQGFLLSPFPRRRVVTTMGGAILTNRDEHVVEAVISSASSLRKSRNHRFKLARGQSQSRGTVCALNDDLGREEHGALFLRRDAARHPL